MKSFYLLMWMVIGIAGCKKNDANNAGSPLRIKSEGDTGGHFIFTYNEEHQQVKSVLDNGFKMTEYVYEPGKVKQIITEPALSIVIHYTIGANNFIQSRKYENANDITYYEYNNEGYISRTYTNDMPVFEMKYYYNAVTGLLDSIRSTRGNLWNSTSVFMYYTDKKNTLSNETYGTSFFGKSSPHPAKAISVRKPEGNQVLVSVTNYNYTYDDKGRITERSFTTSGGQSGTTYYTYQ